MVKFKATMQRAGANLMFEDLFSGSSPEQEIPAPEKPEAARPLFSFDALGILGFGRLDHGQIQLSETMTVAPPAMDINALRDVASAERRARMSSAQPVPVSANAAAQPIQPADADGVAPLETLSDMPAPSGRLNFAGRTAPLPAAFTGAVSFAVLPETSTGAVEPGLLIPRARAGGLAALAYMDAPETEDLPTSDAPRTSFMTETHPEPAAGQVSVAVSEKDGTLHVIAAAPGLSEEAKLKIRGIAEDIANDAGVTLGAFSLNGAAFPDFFNYVRSSSHGRFAYKRGV